MYQIPNISRDPGLVANYLAYRSDVSLRNHKAELERRLKNIHKYVDFVEIKPGGTQIVLQSNRLGEIPQIDNKVRVVIRTYFINLNEQLKVRVR